MNAWVSLSECRSLAFGAGWRLGALAALAGTGATFVRAGGGGDPLTRAAVLALSAMVAALVWGGVFGAWLARSAGRGWRADGAIAGAVEGATGWCSASWRTDGGVMIHGALVRARGGEWLLRDVHGREVSLGRERPTAGESSRGWGAGLLGAPSESLRFSWGIVYVHSAGRVLAAREVEG
jgi:hypothetical protein